MADGAPSVHRKRANGSEKVTYVSGQRNKAENPSSELSYPQNVTDFYIIIS